MSTFADVLLELGDKRVESPAHRAGPWITASEAPKWRLRVSRPTKRTISLEQVDAGKWNAWVIGEVHEYNGRTGSTSSNATRFFQDLAVNVGKPESLSGRFLLVGWSATSKTWNFWTDRTGGIHAYWTGEEGRVAVGTYSGAVYAYSSRKLDWAGLAGFFSLGFFPEDRTYYHDCRVLRPARRYEFSESGRLTNCSEYWSWTHFPDLHRPETDTIAEFGERLGRATLLQSNHGRVVLPLSGGLDSRTLAACVRGRSEIQSFAYGYGDRSIEPAIASQIAMAAGLPFERHTIKPYLFDRLNMNLEAVEGFQDVTQSRQAGIIDWLDANADFVLGGHWGDVLCDDMKLPTGADDTAVLNHLQSKMTKRGSNWLLSNLVQKHLGSDDPSQVVRGCLRGELNRFQHIEDQDFRIKAVKTTQWAFRWTLASLRMYQAAAVPRLPFLDSSVIDFFCTVPTKAVKDRRLQVEYLKAAAVDLARIRWQNYDADLFHYQHFSTWQLPRRAWKRFRRAIYGEPLRRNWEVQFLAPSERGILEECLLRPGLFIHDVTPKASIESLLRGFRSAPDAATGYTVSMLLTFSAWAEKFHRA